MKSALKIKSTVLLSALLGLSLPAWSQLVNPEDVKPLVCGQGEQAMSFHLKALAPTITVNPSDIDPAISVVKAPSYDGIFYGVSLDACLNAQSQLELKRIVYGRSVVYELLAKDSRFTVQGFDLDSLANNYSQLKITATNKNSGVDIEIRGLSKDTVALLKFNDSKELVYDAFVGTLFDGNPFIIKNSGPCPSGVALEQGTITFEQVKLDYEICRFSGTSGTRPYSLESLSVTDSSTNVDATLREKPQVFIKKDISNVEANSLGERAKSIQHPVRYRLNHHNACDSLVIDVPALSAFYTLTSVPVASGCGAPLMGAEPYPVDAKNNPLKQDARAIGRIDYKGKRGKPFEAPFRHHFGVK